VNGCVCLCGWVCTRLGFRVCMRGALGGSIGHTDEYVMSHICMRGVWEYIDI